MTKLFEETILLGLKNMKKGFERVSRLQFLLIREYGYIKKRETTFYKDVLKYNYEYEFDEFQIKNGELTCIGREIVLENIEPNFLLEKVTFLDENDEEIYANFINNYFEGGGSFTFTGLLTIKIG